MTDPLKDAERLAALLDGTLSDDERAEMLARVSSSEAHFDVFADAAAIAHDLEAQEGRPVTVDGEEDDDGESSVLESPRASDAGLVQAEGSVPDTDDDEAASAPRVIAGEEKAREGGGTATAAPDTEGGATVTPLRPAERARRRSMPPVRWLALAAVLAAVALVPVLWSRRGTAEPGDPGRLAALIEDGAAGLPAGWIDTRPWGATRGPGDPLTPEARAVRLGVLLVDLEVAARARQGEAVRLLAAQILVLLEEVPASGPTADGYRAIREAGGASPAELEEGRDGVAGLVADEELLSLGAWAEAARLAAARRDAEFFRTRETRAALDGAAELPLLSDDARAAVERIRRAARGGGAPDWSALRSDIDEILSAAAS
jgi:hypothetical protein